MPIYVLGLGTEIDEAGLTETATETGALYVNAPQASDLKALYEQIAAQLAGQYAISYTSNLPADGTEHRVAVTAQGVTDTKAYQAPEKADTSKKADVKVPAQPVSELFKEVYRYASMSPPVGMGMPGEEAQKFAEAWVLQHKDKDLDKFKEVYRYAWFSPPVGMGMSEEEARKFALKTVNCPL